MAVEGSKYERCSWPAPAKLNLFLRITGRRSNGYHELQTVFRFLDYGDDLAFRLRADGRITCEGNPAIPPSQDLCVKAAQLLQRHAGVLSGVDIRVTKRIPIGGGLGGGSSDAATTLLALNRLWELGLPRDDLMGLGLRLGADVPVFIGGRTAWAEGVGEHLTPVFLPDQYYLVLVPPVSVSTARVFADRKLTRDARPITIRDFLAGAGRNDLESIVREIYPEVDTAIRWLGQYGAARMTGTGSAVFLPVEDSTRGQQILMNRPSGFEGFVARGVDTHPLLDS